MLPDYPDLKARLSTRIMKYMAQQAISGTGMEEIFVRNASFVHEGGSAVYHFPGGIEETMNFKRASTSMSLKHDEITQAQASALLGQIDQAAQSLASQKARILIDAIDRAAEVSDSVIKGTGTVTVQTFFDALRRFDMDFDEQGRPQLPTFFGGANAARETYAVIEEIDGNPSLRADFEQIIEEKWDAYRDREADRQLVG